MVRGKRMSDQNMLISKETVQQCGECSKAISDGDFERCENCGMVICYGCTNRSNDKPYCSSCKEDI